jgi:hypothetical protein
MRGRSRPCSKRGAQYGADYFELHDRQRLSVPCLRRHRVGLIYLLILAFVISVRSQFHACHAPELTEEHRWQATQHTSLTTIGQHLRFSHLVGLRLITPCILYFFPSLAYALLDYFSSSPLIATLAPLGSLLCGCSSGSACLSCTFR